MVMIWHQYILIGFAISVLSEWLLIKLFFRETPWTKILLIVFCVHCVSHPFATVVFYFLGFSFWFTEAGVVLIEFLLYKNIFKKNYFKIISIVFLANIFSVMIGMLFRNIFSINIF